MGERCKVKESKHRFGFPRNVKSMSKEVLDATLKKKRECDARALKIVERLLETDVTEETFLDCLPFIHDSHFQDAVEERALSKLCGYPLCSARLKRFLEGRYRISTKLNKVYDITERKNFCSNECYKSARFVKDQLLTSPLWLRDREEIPSFTLLPSFASGGIAGDEVDIGKVPSLKEEVQRLKPDNETSPLANTVHTSKRIKDERQKVEPIEAEEEVDYGSHETTTQLYSVAKSKTVAQHLGSDSVTKEGIQSQTEVSEISQCVLMWKDEVQVQNSPILVGTTLNQTSTRQSETLDNTTAAATTNQTGTFDNLEYTTNTINKEAKLTADACLPQSSVARIEMCLEEWFTVESLCTLLGEDAVREMVSNLGESLKDHYKPVDVSVCDPSLRERYQNICRRLNLMELEDIRYDNRITSEGQALKPLPDYSVVKEESLKMQLKVRAFYNGKTCYETVPPREVETEIDGTEDTSYLPLVDIHAKCALRRRIVLDRLNRVIPGLMQLFQLSFQEVTADVRVIVSTFALEAHNITFKPTEWKLLGLVLVKMISLKNAKIKLALESEKAKNYTATILAVFRQHDHYLDGLLAQLTDVKNVLGRRTKLSSGHR